MFDPPLLEYAAVAELSKLDQWVMWRLEKRDKKSTKVPLVPSATEFKYASSTNRKTWDSFSEAVRCGVQGGVADGVGFVLTPKDPYIFVDLDGCIEHGQIAKWARAIIDKLQSYTEISPSKAGLHVFGRGKKPLPPDFPNRKGQIEIYAEKRYFTVTGQHLDGYPEEIRDISEAMLSIFPPERIELSERDSTGDDLLDEVIVACEPHVKGDASYPKQRLDAMCANVPAFKAVWERTKTGSEKWTPSEWDLSIASYLIGAAWSIEDIVGTMISARRKHGNDLKLRVDYYARTIVKARKRRDKEQLEDKIIGGDLALTGTPEEKKQEIFDAINKILFPGNKVKINTVIKYTSDPPSYKIVTGNGSCTMTAGEMLSRVAFRAHIMDASRIVTPVFKENVWRPLIQYLLDVADDETAGHEATDYGMAATLLRSYLQDKPPVGELHKEEAAVAGNPFHHKKCIWIVSADFTRWVQRVHSKTMTAKKIGMLLRAAGLRAMSFPVPRPGERDTSRYCWYIGEDSEVLK